MWAIAALLDIIRRFPFWMGGVLMDTRRFHFFQGLTPVGGCLLLAAFGPGRFSVDAKSGKSS